MTVGSTSCTRTAGDGIFGGAGRSLLVTTSFAAFVDEYLHDARAPFPKVE